MKNIILKGYSLYLTFFLSAAGDLWLQGGGGGGVWGPGRVLWEVKAF